MTLRKIGLVVIFSFCLCSLCLAKPEAFPFLAQAVKDKVNVRAGENVNFEKLCQISPTDKVLVVGKNYAWYKIELPTSCPIYISKKYIRECDAHLGEVLAKDVNLRAKPNINASVLGRVTLGDKIYILEESADWYKIEPTQKTYGWVSEDMLTFQSQNVSSYKDNKQLPQKIREYEAQKSSNTPLAKETQESHLTVQKKEEQETFIKTEGILEKRMTAEADPIQYLISENHVPAYFVEGPQDIIREFVNHRVTVEGMVNFKLKEQYPYPVLTIKRIQFVL
ncbi:MAG: SH3 domain-containing protein [Candidatus Omnitrophica bacterium]|nr:SH3 domain-containing protein [Candidatus Omnitrophota bacterium]